MMILEIVHFIKQTLIQTSSQNSEEKIVAKRESDDAHE